MNECVTTGIEVLDVRLNNELNPSKTCIPSAGPENQTSHIGIEYGSIFEVSQITTVMDSGYCQR